MVHLFPGREEWRNGEIHIAQALQALISMMETIRQHSAALEARLVTADLPSVSADQRAIAAVARVADNVDFRALNSVVPFSGQREECRDWRLSFRACLSEFAQIVGRRCRPRRAGGRI